MAEEEQAFLSIKDAADYLNVEYKTIYRLVRSGDLPAGRIGGVYRIKRTDLEQFFEQQKMQPGAAATSRQAPPDMEAEAMLSEETTAPTLEKAEPLLRCGRCLRLIADPTAAGGVCAATGCDKLICVDCWQKPDGHLCQEHVPSLTQKLAAAQQSLREHTIPCLVTGVEARKRELNFLSRFDQKIHHIVTIRHPLSGRILRIDDWQKRHTCSDDTARLLDLRGVGYLDKTLVAQTPINQRSRYDVPDADDTSAMIIEAIVLSHLDPYVQQGFDTNPLTLVELLPLLTTAMKEAETADTAYILGLAAASGWDPTATGYIQADVTGKSFTHRLLMPCLIDLETGTLIYNSLDQRLAPLAPLFALQLEDELIEDLARRLRETLLGGKWGSISASQAATELGASEDLVARAFARLDESGQFSVEQIKGVGLAVSRRLG